MYLSCVRLMRLERFVSAALAVELVTSVFPGNLISISRFVHILRGPGNFFPFLSFVEVIRLKLSKSVS